MKKVIFILTCVLFISTFAIAQKVNNKVKGPIPLFTERVHDFGKINASAGDAYCTFKVKNTGDEPLIIERVHTSCGCTTSDFTKEPILPGKDGNIQVKYAASGRIGTFNKKISVYSNVLDETIYTLTIQGEVLAR